MGTNNVQPENNAELEWKVALVHIEDTIAQYKTAGEDSADGEAKARLAEEIVKAYRHAAECAPDEDKREKMNETAEEFANADEETRDAKLHPLLMGLSVLLAAPFALAGGVLWGAGQVLIGLGDVLTGGSWFRRKVAEQAKKTFSQSS